MSKILISDETIQNNIKLFAKLGLEVTELEARHLANKVEVRIRKGKKPTFESIKSWLAQMRSRDKPSDKLPLKNQFSYPKLIGVHQSLKPSEDSKFTVPELCDRFYDDPNNINGVHNA